MAFLYVDDGLSAVCQVGQGRYHSHSPGNGGEGLSRVVRLREMAGKHPRKREEEIADLQNRNGTYVSVDPVGFLLSGRDERI